MTAITSYPSMAKPAGFEALLITVGRFLITAGERLAVEHQRSREAFAQHEEQLRDRTAMRHSGLWS
ncbi:hypothetical protein [Arthrobacter sp. H5]|uniref:hypothetical protein n=1 Tax=Arthrobacter sp. H5 TaxID=1267973 RepID=UPI0012DC3C33|nr:hypothetical protein [Arthrobacter sp. H5]